MRIRSHFQPTFSTCAHSWPRSAALRPSTSQGSAPWRLRAWRADPPFPPPHTPQRCVGPRGGGGRNSSAPPQAQVYTKTNCAHRGAPVGFLPRQAALKLAPLSRTTAARSCHTPAHALARPLDPLASWALGPFGPFGLLALGPFVPLGPLGTLEPLGPQRAY